MTPNKMQRLYDEFGQSLWYDNIARGLLNDGTIKSLVDQGVRGLTSNPAIFEKAIVGSSVYDEQLRELSRRGRTVHEILEAVTVQDIQHAADILRPVYDASKGGDGFVSLEVSPLIASSTEDTVKEAARLWGEVNRPNLMVKIPATPQGLPAIEESLYHGLNINVTLIFSRDVYTEVMAAYQNAIRRRVEEGKPVDRIASVASFFVSRVDTLVDNLLDEKAASASGDQKDHLLTLRGKAGVANARLAYKLFKEAFYTDSFKELVGKHGASYQRPLWASTSTKNPAYPDTLYVDTLIGQRTVNTAPPKTIDAFVDHGVLAATIEDDLDGAQQTMDDLAAAGVDMQAVTDQLLEEGVEKFEKPFRTLLNAVEEKCRALVESPAS